MKRLARIFSLVAAVALSGTFAEALVWTPSFDSSLTGYSSVGSVSGVLNYTLGTEGTVVSAPNGGYMALLTSEGYDTEDFGGTNGAIFFDALALNAGDSVEFYWLFDAEDYIPFNDFSLYFQDQLLGSMSTYSLSDIAAVGDYGNTGWQLFSLDLESDFQGSAGWVVSNYADTGLNSSLLIASTAVSSVPEPSTLLLLGSGLVGLGFFGRRRKV